MTGLAQYLACEWKDLKHATGTVSAPQSTAASAAGIQATFICGGFWPVGSFGWAYTE